MRTLKSLLIDSVLLPYTSRGLLLLIPITFLGFYPTYYSTFDAPTIIHIHGTLMALWLMTGLLQPWLIKSQQFKWHRQVGRFSYILMPAVLLCGYFVLQHGYQDVLGGKIVAPTEYYPTGADARTKAADFVVIGSVYFIWLLCYYLLGIYFRKQVQAHATFMLAATLTILGPAGDRLVGHICDALGWKFNAIAENFTFGIVFVVFATLLRFHHRKNLALWPAITVLILHLIGIFFFYQMPFHPAWDWLAALLFQ